MYLFEPKLGRVKSALSTQNSSFNASNQPPVVVHCTQYNQFFTSYVATAAPSLTSEPDNSNVKRSVPSKGRNSDKSCLYNHLIIRTRTLQVLNSPNTEDDGRNDTAKGKD